MMLSSSDVRFSLVICALVLCANYVDAAMTMAQIENMAKGMRNSCQAKTGADPGILNNMKNGEFPADEKFQCYLKCVMTIVKSLKNGKPQLEPLLKQVKIMPVEIQPTLTAIANHCVTLDFSDDPCVAAWQFVQCQYSQGPEVFFFP